MQHLVAIAEIKSRAEAIGVSLRKLALTANVSPANAYRAARGDQDPRVSTVRKLTAALEAKEQAARLSLQQAGQA